MPWAHWKRALKFSVANTSILIRNKKDTYNDVLSNITIIRTMIPTYPQSQTRKIRWKQFTRVDAHRQDALRWVTLWWLQKWTIPRKGSFVIWWPSRWWQQEIDQSELQSEQWWTSFSWTLPEKSKNLKVANEMDGDIYNSACIFLYSHTTKFFKKQDQKLRQTLLNFMNLKRDKQNQNRTNKLYK